MRCQRACGNVNAGKGAFPAGQSFSPSSSRFLLLVLTSGCDRTHVPDVSTGAPCRPYNQGARLTAYELVVEGIPATLLVDSAAGALMATGGADVVVVGADRVAANGDTANKIGTCMIAAAAATFGVPFFVAAPLTSIDLAVLSGGGIEIEERGAMELTHSGGRRVVVEGVGVWNPAFDVTAASHITGVLLLAVACVRCGSWLHAVRLHPGNHLLARLFVGDGSPHVASWLTETSRSCTCATISRGTCSAFARVPDKPAIFGVNSRQRPVTPACLPPACMRQLGPLVATNNRPFHACKQESSQRKASSRRKAMEPSTCAPSSLSTACPFPPLRPLPPLHPLQPLAPFQRSTSRP
jgi:hypothetical protein